MTPERRLAVLMGMLVSVLLCAYTIAKVLRDALFLQEFGALKLPAAYVGVAVASAAYVVFEARLARRFSLTAASRVTQYSAVGFSILAAAAHPVARRATAAVFYLWTGSQALMLIAHFWGLALDVWDSRRARRLFPIMSGCGLAGGLLGGAIAAASPFLKHTGLMWILSGLLLVTCVLTELVARHRDRSRTRPGNAPGLSLLGILKQSGYVRALVIALALSVVIGTLVDFQFKLLLQKMYPDAHHLSQFLGTFYVGLNAVSLLLQFGAAGWLLQRLGLAVSTALQPGAVLVFVGAAAVTTGGWGVIALRWVQGLISQTLGKSSTEIYYAAIHPVERRRLKPAIDTLVERWSDALVGVFLLVVLRLLRVPMGAIIATTGVLAAVWLVTLIVLDRRFGREFSEALSHRWVEPEGAPDSIRVPSARAALISALSSDDERQVLAALRLTSHAQDAETAAAIRKSVTHDNAAVRAAAVDAMSARGLADPDRAVAGLVADGDDAVRRAAVRYLVARAPDARELARNWIHGDDRALREHFIDALLDQPSLAAQVLEWSWIDDRLKNGVRDDVLLAARALGAMAGQEVSRRLTELLRSDDVEVRRAALLAAARRPDASLIDQLVPALSGHEIGEEARSAIAAIGEAAVPALSRLLEGNEGEHTQERAASTLAQIAGPHAAACLVRLTKSGDARLRYLGLKGLARIRIRTGRATLRRSIVHRHFLRELSEFRRWSEAAEALSGHEAAEVRLLSDSFQESAERALERSLMGLASWYDAKPLISVYDRLKSKDLTGAAPALEYLGHVLPRRVFRPVNALFESKSMKADSKEATAPAPPAAWIKLAWDSGDAWLKACAVRASRHVPDVDPALFAEGAAGEPLVEAELVALRAA
jgi:AAA family ATP:ADP antiporter